MKKTRKMPNGNLCIDWKKSYEGLENEYESYKEKDASDRRWLAVFLILVAVTVCINTVALIL